MDCIFCQIVEKKIPAYVVYEDEYFLGFLDIHPLSAGHTLVIPKSHHRWVWDVPHINRYFEVVQKIAKAQQKAFGVEMIQSKIVGEEVPHAHVWVFPFPAHSSGDKTDFKGNAEKIVSALS